MTRAIVCGGRWFGRAREFLEEEHWSADEERVRRQRDLLVATLSGYGLTAIAQGGAYGADRCAFDWARANNVPVTTYPANWRTDGKAAGPKRNARMICEFNPQLVIAFPGGNGTADMCAKAEAAGVRVIRIEAP